MAATGTVRRPKSGPLLMILGAILLFIGPMLTFASFDLSGAGAEFEADFRSLLGDQSGYELEEGSTYVLFGGILLVIGIVLLFARRGAVRRVLAVVAFLAAAAALVAGYIDATGVAEVVEASLGFLTGSAGTGPWVVVAGSLLALVGSVLAFRAPALAVVDEDAPATAPPPAAPPPTTPPPADPPPGG